MEASREGAALPPCRHGGTQQRFVSPWAVAERNSALYGGGNGCCAVRKRPSYGGGAGRKTLWRRNGVDDGGLAARREREHRRSEEEFSFLVSALDTRILMRVLSWGLRVQGTLVGFVKHVSARAHRSGAVACPGVSKTVSLKVLTRTYTIDVLSCVLECI